MNVKFYKYQGTGNDFVIIDNRAMAYCFTTAQIAFLCNRRFGIGADGLMLLQSKSGVDFEMIYYNSDGNESTMCGNGGRAMIRFANDLKITGESCHFDAIDGIHLGKLNNDNTISLKMTAVHEIKQENVAYILDTGSPHYVVFRENIAAINVKEAGAAIRYSPPFSQHGINVNFAEITAENKLAVRTYERGVEDETLSCGTGTVAAVLAFAEKNQIKATEVNVNVPGGKLSVSFEKTIDGYKNIWLTGPAEKVFEGEIIL